MVKSKEIIIISAFERVRPNLKGQINRDTDLSDDLGAGEEDVRQVMERALPDGLDVNISDVTVDTVGDVIDLVDAIRCVAAED